MQKHNEQILADMLDSDGNRLTANAIVPWGTNGVNLANSSSVFTNTNVADGAFNFAGDGSIITDPITAPIIGITEVVLFETGADIVTSQSVSGFYGFLDFVINTSRLFMRTFIGSSINFTQNIAINTRYFAVIVVTPTDYKFYINGVLVSTQTSTNSLPYTFPIDHGIGAKYDSTVFLTGKVFNQFTILKALSTTEVSELHKQITGDYS